MSKCLMCDTYWPNIVGVMHSCPECPTVKSLADCSDYIQESIAKAQASFSNPNPKHNQGAAKLPLHLWPQSATALGSIGMLEGACKYGRNNFRATPVYASVYYAACLRHLAAWFNGEDCEEVSAEGKVIQGKPHLAGALANLAIIVDAEANGSLIDDRNHTPDQEANYAVLEQYLTPLVSIIQELYADRNPKHYTIQDDSADL